MLHLQNELVRGTATKKMGKGKALDPVGYKSMTYLSCCLRTTGVPKPSNKIVNYMLIGQIMVGFKIFEPFTWLYMDMTPGPQNGGLDKTSQNLRCDSAGLGSYPWPFRGL